jgi:hypothetical protein
MRVAEPKQTESHLEYEFRDTKFRIRPMLSLSAQWFFLVIYVTKQN